MFVLTLNITLGYVVCINHSKHNIQWTLVETQNSLKIILLMKIQCLKIYGGEKRIYFLKRRTCDILKTTGLG